MKKEDLKKQLKLLLKDGPALASLCLMYLEENFKVGSELLTKAKQELNIQSIQSSDKKWYWYDPTVKMDRRDLAEWLKDNNSVEISEEEQQNEIQKEMKEFSKEEDPYGYIEEEHIYRYHKPTLKKLRKEEKESREHRKAYKENYDYNAFPSYNYGIDPSKCN